MSLVRCCASSSFSVIVWITSRMDKGEDGKPASLKADLFSLYVQEKITNGHLARASKRPSWWDSSESGPVVCVFLVFMHKSKRLMHEDVWYIYLWTLNFELMTF